MPLTLHTHFQVNFVFSLHVTGNIHHFQFLTLVQWYTDCYSRYGLVYICSIVSLIQFVMESLWKCLLVCVFLTMLHTHIYNSVLQVSGFKKFEDLARSWSCVSFTKKHLFGLKQPYISLDGWWHVIISFFQLSNDIPTVMHSSVMAFDPSVNICIPFFLELWW